METCIIAIPILVFLPWCKNEKSACHACLKAAFLWFPVLPDGFILYMDERVSLLQTFVLDAFLTFADTWRYQHIALCGNFHQLLMLPLPEKRLLRSHCLPIFFHSPMKEHLHLLGMPQQHEVAESTIAYATYHDTKRAPHQMRPFTSH